MSLTAWVWPLLRPSSRISGATGSRNASCPWPGFFQRRAVHPRHHQHAAGLLLLNDGRDQAVGVELQLIVKTHIPMISPQNGRHWKRKAEMRGKIQRPAVAAGHGGQAKISKFLLKPAIRPMPTLSPALCISDVPAPSKPCPAPGQAAGPRPPPETAAQNSHAVGAARPSAGPAGTPPPRRNAADHPVQ